MDVTDLIWWSKKCYCISQKANTKELSSRYSGSLMKDINMKPEKNQRFTANPMTNKRREVIKIN
jgi:hypothetical protein